MAETNSLLNCRTGNGTGGSNPPPSANKKLVNKLFTSFFIIPLGILLFIQGYFFRGMSAEHTVVSA